MKPMLDAGTQLIYTMCFAKSNIRIGDIIRYLRSDGEYIVHQVIEIKSDGVVTKGINNAAPDADLVPWANIKGILVMVIY